MPLLDQYPVNTYVATGSTTFPFTFQIFVPEDLKVEIDKVPKIYGTDYTLTGIGDSVGGKVEFLSAPDDGALVVVYRDVSAARETDYAYQGAFREAIVDKDFDRIYMILQQLNREFSRAIKLPIGESTELFSGYGPLDRAGKMLAFDLSGGPALVNNLIGDLGSTIVCENVATAKALNFSDVASGTPVWIQGYTEKGDGGHGMLFWDPSDLLSDVGDLSVIDPRNGIYVVPNGFSPDGSQGALRRQYDEIVSAAWFGVSGSLDITDALKAADSFGSKYYIKDGEYLFTGENLPNIKNMVRESENVIFKNQKYQGIVQWDRSGHLIGLHHNHLEEKALLSGITNQISSGNIVAPPLGRPINAADVDIIAFWYQDFGLDSTRDSSTGSNKWYSWEWAHTDVEEDLLSSPIVRGYQGKRHPILGWYRGDDKNVLDWQCYWLSESGISSVVLQGRGANNLLDTATWSSISNINNWIYKLLNVVPNARNLRFIPWVSHGDFSGNYGDSSALAAIEAAWDNNIQVVHNSGLAKTFKHEGKSYIAVYVFEGESLRGDFDNYSGSTNLLAMLGDRASFAQSLGYDGLCILARNPSADSVMRRAKLLDNSILYIESGYLDSTASPIGSFATYGQYVDGWSNSFTFAGVSGVHTDGESSSHPSDWSQSGSSPELFEKVLTKAIAYAKKTPFRTKAVTIYNVSEWAEGGASLQPTMAYGWAYLDAVRNAVIANSGSEVPFQTHYIAYKPASSVPITTKLIWLGSDYAQTFGAFTPFLASGTYQGQEVTITNYSPVGALSLTIPDDSVVSGSKMFFRGGASKVLGPWESVSIYWEPTKGWIEK